jgi:hypothetical protein
VDDDLVIKLVAMDVSVENAVQALAPYDNKIEPCNSIIYLFLDIRKCCHPTEAEIDNWLVRRLSMG